MKNLLKSALAVVLCLILCICLIACNNEDGDTNPTPNPPQENNKDNSGTTDGNGTPPEQSGIQKTGIWQNATYVSDTTIGQGAKEIKIVISGENQSITLTVKTDKANLGEALYELNLINDDSFFDTLNGIKADWNVNESWWKFCNSEGTALNYGVSDAQINGGETYKFVYTIGF